MTIFVSFLHQNATFTFTFPYLTISFFYEVLQPPNDKIGKFRLFYLLRFVKPMFSFGVSHFFASSLFLTLVYLKKPHCVSITCEELTGFQEEDHDRCRCLSFQKSSL